MKLLVNNTGLLLMVLLASVCAGNAEKEHEALTKEIITHYDNVMKKVKEKIRVKNQLRQTLDSSQSEEYKAAIRRLDQAHKGVMLWRENFLQYFPEMALTDPGYHHHPHTSHEHDASKGQGIMMSSNDMEKLLEDERLKVMEVHAAMDKAIAGAKAILVP